MTYGEATIKARENCTIKEGIAIFKKQPYIKRLSKEEAYIHYNNKLFKYWKEQMSDVIPTGKKVKVLNFLLGRKECQQ